MKKTTYILATFITVLSCGLVSCMDDFDVPNTDDAFGNNSIKEERTIKIAELKQKYADIIKANGLKEIEEETRIEGVVIGDDKSGNIYKQLMVADESGAIVVSINNTGLYALCPVGQKVVIDCQNLYVGGYGEMGQIGYAYNGKVGRMPEYVWESHVRLIGQPDMKYPELTPMEITSNDLKTLDKNRAPLLVHMNHVRFEDANGKEVYAKDNGGKVSTVEHNLVFEDGKKLIVRTSTYANFAKEPLPEGDLNITAVLTRFRNIWQLTIRDIEEVKINK